MTESTVRAFLIGMLAAWMLSFVTRRVRWWFADRAFKKMMARADESMRHRRSVEKLQGPAVVAVKETDPWPK